MWQLIKWSLEARNRRAPEREAPVVLRVIGELCFSGGSDEWAQLGHHLAFPGI